MRKVRVLFFVSFVFQFVNAQQGSPLLTHYTESRNIENQSWAICQDDDRVMHFANRKGILIFDGVDWTTLKLPTLPYSMQKNPFDGNIYIGGENNFGYIGKDGAGTYLYFQLWSDSSATGAITQIVFDGMAAWFCSEQSVNRFNLRTNKLDLRINARPGYPFSGIFVTPENTFINVLNKGLYRLESDTLFPLVTGYLTEKTEILFSLPYNKKLVLLGLGNSSLKLFDGIKYYDYMVKDEGYLEENILSEGIALGDSAYAFSTLDGGAIVVEKSSRKVLFTINNQNDLPDDEVYALGADNMGGLWLSHEYGLTRADLKLPVANFRIFPGLVGNLSSALKYKDELYVATSEGVFYLSEVRSYDEKEILVKTKEMTKSPSGKEKEAIPQEKGNTRKNIFMRIFGRKAGQAYVVRDEKPSRPVETVKYTSKKVSTLKSVNYVYRKVEGLNEKCRQLVSTPYGILAATNKGLYIINEHKAGIVTPYRYINHISWKASDSTYFIAAADGFFSIIMENGKWITKIPCPDFLNPVYSIILDRNNNIWLGGDNIVYRADMTADVKARDFKTYLVKNSFPERYTLGMLGDSVLLFSETGVYLFDNSAEGFEIYDKAGSEGTDIPEVYYPLSNRHLALVNDKWTEYGSSGSIDNTELALLKIFDNVVSVTVEGDKIWIIEGNNRIYGIDRKKSAVIDPLTSIVIKNISNAGGTLFDLHDVKFNRGDNVISFSIVAPGYLKQNTTLYQYNINKVMSGWSPWSVRTNYVETVTRPGDYLLKVRAMDLWGNVGDPVSVKFTITAPFTKTVWFYLLAGLLLLLLIIFIVHLREKQLSNKNKILEEKVRERTAEIESKKMEITSSIEYAGRIQKAILPVEDHFREAFGDYFIIYKPRDIVSGDFYWIAEDEKSIFFTVADCTGHGVPGAFMSSMGISTLHEIIANSRNLQANKVLNLLRNKIVKALHQTGKSGEMADGMDIAFCILSKDRKKLQFSGAFNPMVIIQGGEFVEYKGDRMPIGIHHGKETTFTNHRIDVNRGDTIFLFSDGFASQFGGPDGVKYKKANFKDLLSGIYSLPMSEQRKILETEFENWKGTMNQVDDITILGLRI